MSVRVSVIICSYNRAQLLSGLFAAFQAQTYPSEDFELILINDGSTDNTDEVVSLNCKAFKNLKYFRNDHNIGLANSANRGIEAAESDILLFTDDDCRPASDWVEKMILAVSKFPIVCGQVISPLNPYLTLARNVAEYHPILMRQNSGQIRTIAGANMGFQRKVFSGIGKFKPDCVTPDMELIFRALGSGYQIEYEPDCKITHYPVQKSLAQVFHYEASRSFSTIQLRKQYKRLFRTPFVFESAFLLIVLSPFLALFKVIQVYTSKHKLLKYLHTFPVVFLLKIAWCLGAANGIRNLVITGNVNQD